MAALLSNRKRVYAGTSSASTVSTVDEARSMLESAAKMGSGNGNVDAQRHAHSSGLGVGGATESLQVGSGGDLTPDEDHERVALDLLHMAAIKGNTQAQLALRIDTTAAMASTKTARRPHFIFGIVAEKALNEHQSGGAEQVHDHKRLSWEAEDHIDQGEMGEEDERIEYQRMMAEQGNVDAMLAMGDLYYYGAGCLEIRRSIGFVVLEALRTTIRAAKQG